MSVDPRVDDMLFGILNNVGNIEKFLDTLFCFLFRRTDFFHVKTSSSEKLGLPPGVAQRIVKMVCQKYVHLEKAKMERIKAASDSAAAEEDKGVKSAEEKPLFKKQEANNNTSSSSVVGTAQDHDVCKEDTSHKAEEKLMKTANEAEERSVETSNVTGKRDQVEAPNSTGKEDEVETAKEDDERRYYDNNPECYNGASYDNYSWAQNNFELDVQVKVPNGVKSATQVKVLVEKTHLKVEALQDEKWETFLDGTLMYDVKVGTSTWTLHPNDHIHVNLEKDYPRYWEALLEGEPKINVRAIDCSIPFEDIDEEAQAKLQQMMFDQHQKRLGKPTSEEIKVQEMLKKAWNTKDSPFRGQEFDPSVIRMTQ